MASHIRLFHLCICLLTLLPGNTLIAQSSSGPYLDWTGPSQDYSPSAAELGRYGRTPVNYFTGLPSIQVPLTELRAKNYTLPVYISYHAGGNKPDVHPGWVGLGWSLRAGGCVNRIINGKKDDMSKAEYNAHIPAGGNLASEGVGYYYRALAVQTADWTDPTIYCSSLDEPVKLDREPDEFQICLEDFQASCFISGPDGRMTVVTKSGEDARVEIQLVEGGENPIEVYRSSANNEIKSAKRYNYFNQIVLTRQDGTRYVFGGDDTAIEYSIALTPRYQNNSAGFPVNQNEWNATATANTWFLSRIERPDGEMIRFHYEKDGVPIVRHDRHFEEDYYAWTPSYVILIQSEDTRDNPDQLRNISFSLLKPSYLSLIEAEISKDSIKFTRSRTTELQYSTNQYEFYQRAGYYGNYFSFNHLKAQDYYMRLQGVVSRRDTLLLNYSSDTGKRLRLYGVSSYRQGIVESQYRMRYDSTSLPAYHARQTDSWGYYNGISYASSVLDTNQKVRWPDPVKIKAEMLTELIYPTGGKTEFIYEPNTYAKEIEAGIFTLSSLAADAMGGGLRIKEIRDIAQEGKVESRKFSYLDTNGRSSGVSSGFPRFFLHGRTLQKQKYHGFPWNFSDTTTLQYTCEYFLADELPVRPLARTDGSNVTYSRVTETFGDGGFSVYRYYNQDEEEFRDKQPTMSVESMESTLLTYPCNSLQLSRGLLKSREDHSPLKLVRKEECLYEIDTLQALNAVYYDSRCHGMVLSSAYYKVFSYYPSLKEKIVTSFPDTGSVSVCDKNLYQYDGYRNLTRTDQIRGSDTLSVCYSYSGSFNSGVYATMQDRNMVSYPLETVKRRGGKFVEAELTTYTQTGDERICPKSRYRASLGSGVSSFSFFDGMQKDSRYGVAESDVKKYDRLGNPLQIEHRSGVSDIYFWSEHGMYPSCIFEGFGVSLPSPIMGYQDRIFEKTQPIYSEEANGILLEFDCEEPFQMPVELICPPGQNWCVLLQMDSGTFFPLVRINSNYMQSPWNTYAQYYNYSGSIAVSAGHHILRLVNKVYYKQGGSSPTIAVLNYTVHQREEVISGYSEPQTALYEDFEITGNTDDGFYSSRSWTGSYTVSLAGGVGTHALDYRVRQGEVWDYRTTHFSGDSYVINEGDNPVDDIRVYPESAQVETYHWLPGGIIRSITDGRGISESYEYDGRGRLARIKDNEGHPVEEYAYHYASYADSSNYIKKSTFITDQGTKREIISYHDGLGRPHQTIQKEASPSGGDILDLLEFDSNGRDSLQWLPVAIVGNNGRERPASFFPQHLGDYVSLYGDTWPTSCVTYDGSPLSRTRKKAGPGAAWHSAGKGIEFSYQSSLSSPEYKVPRYRVVDANGIIVIIPSGPAPNGAYSVVRDTDEDERTVLVFSDNEGRTIQRVQRYVTGNTEEFLRTSYVYDEAGRLLAVFPPMLTSVLSDTSTSASASLPAILDYGYFYRYDARGRMIAKKLPGADWIYYIYDKGDRLIFSQDGEQRKSGIWAFYLQDDLGRDCMRGTCTNTLNAFTGPLDDTNVFVLPGSSSQIFFYQIQGDITLTNPIYLSVNWWDTYSVLTAIQNPFLAYTIPSSGYGSKYSSSAKGLLTIHYAKVLGDPSVSQIIWETYYYDDKDQMIQRASTTHLGGYEKEYLAYDFTGNVTALKKAHGISGNNILIEEYCYKYDNWGRPLTTLHTLGTGTPDTLANFTYDSVGRLARDTRNGSAMLDTRISHNVRGWITNYAVGYDALQDTTGVLFSESLFYNTSMPSGTTPLQWGGNISGIQWSSGQSGISDIVSYSYDNLSRLTSACGGLSQMNYSYEYDYQGNITSLTWPSGTWTFGYSGNKAVTGTWGGTVSQYSYDKNGRMSSFGGISLTYNDVGLPASKGTSGNITTWTYSADGVKLRRTNGTHTTDYVGNLIFKDGQLDKIMIEGGFVDMSGATPAKRFFVKDHLGSNRLVTDVTGVILQENHYDPYGQDQVLNGANTGEAGSDYKFGGKEWDTQSGMYDFLARMYIPFMARFSTMDPLAEKYYSISPYAYCVGNPVNLVDPNGRDGMVTGSGTKDDPYVITAVYFYQAGENGLSNDYVKGLIEAISQYNNKGVCSYKDETGERIFFMFSLSAVKAEDPETSRITQTGFETQNGDIRYYGNLIGTEASLNGSEYGSANNIRIDFNLVNIGEMISKGFDKKKLIQSTALHEIGHNLGAEHEDSTPAMLPLTWAAGTTNAYYPYVTKKHLVMILKRMDTQKNESSDGRIWKRK